MWQNVGSADKVIRIIIGIVLLSMLFWVPGNANYWGLIGLLPLVTALVNWCPAYTLLGVRTNSPKGSD